MGASNSKLSSSGVFTHSQNQVQCLEKVTQVCDLLAHAAAKKGAAVEFDVARQLVPARALAKLEPDAQNELLALTGAQVLQVAAELQKLDASLTRCHSKAAKLAKQPSLLAGRRQVVRQTQRIIGDMEDAHLCFRMAVKTGALCSAAVSPPVAAGAGAWREGKQDAQNSSHARLAPGVLHTAGVRTLPHPLTSANSGPFSDLRAAAEAGDNDAALQLGDLYSKGTASMSADHTEALHYYLTAAAAGSGAACYALGQMAELGQGSVAPRPQEAAQWYEKAAKAGHLEGSVEYAHLLEHGQHVPKDEAAALELYQRAAAQGSARAHNQLAVMLYDGRATKQDLPAAFQHFQIAADGGSTAALASLGICYEEGLGVDSDLEKAETYYSAASAAGHEAARANLAFLRRRLAHAQPGSSSIACGPTTAGAVSPQAMLPADEAGFHYTSERPGPSRTSAQATSSATDDAAVIEEARQWHAAQAGDAEAQYWVASAYWDEGETASALYFYHAAAAQQHAGALVALAIIAEEGQGGMQRDLAQALHYYRMASLQGSQEAADRLKELGVAQHAKA